MCIRDRITADLQVTVDSFLKFADFFFDGLFADWAVLDHINQAQSRVETVSYTHLGSRYPGRIGC